MAALRRQHRDPARPTAASDAALPRERAGGEEALTFAYHRAVAPMMWVLLALATLELAVVHLLVALWNPVVAVVLSVVSLAGIGWLLVVLRSFRRLPVRLEADALLMRVGTLKSCRIPLSAIAGVRGEAPREEVRARTTVNLALLAWPNTIIDLSEPLGRRGTLTTVAHRLDDPAQFAARLRERLER